MHSQDCNSSLMFMFHFKKSVTVFGFLITFFCPRAQKLISQQNDWRRRHTSNTSSYFISSRGKHAITNIREKNCRRSCTNYNSLVYAKELYILPGMETRQFLCRMFVTLKKLKSCFILLKME